MEAGGPRVVISARLARMLEPLLGRSAVGHTITVGEQPYEVAGVMPPSFAFPSPTVDAWLGLPAVTDDLRGDLDLVARLRPEATVASTGEAVIRVVHDTYNDEWTAMVTRLDEALLGQARPAVLVSLAAAVLVLMVAGANTAASCWDDPSDETANSR